ncbi:tRNA dihydrouridine synthase, partial [Podospora bellae-mahoneyi]
FFFCFFFVFGGVADLRLQRKFKGRFATTTTTTTEKVNLGREKIVAFFTLGRRLLHAAGGRGGTSQAASSFFFGSRGLYSTMATAPTTDAPAAATGKKLHGREFYESIGSPKYILAPMVDQSEFAWRMLSRSFMPPELQSKLLAYTPMFHARLFSQDAPKPPYNKYRDSHFQCVLPKDPATLWLDGNPLVGDRPLFVQFCANDPQHLLAAALKVAPYCDAVDLNLGCPQGIAKKGHYGSFLQEDQELIYRLINTLHENLPIPVTAKIRILETKEKTLEYAKNVLSAGASILTVHGRRREQKSHLTGVADWEYIRYLRDNLPAETVIFANGNVLEHGDIEECIAATGADGVMSAEGNLSNPAIFAPEPQPGAFEDEFWRGRDGKGGWRVDAVFRRYLDILHKYVKGGEPPARRPLFVPGKGMDTEWMKEEIVIPPKKGSKSEAFGNPNYGALQAHMFHLLRHFVSKHHDVRDALARARLGELEQFEGIYKMVEKKVAEGLIEYEETDGKSMEDPAEEERLKKLVEEMGPAETSATAILRCKRPWWCVQPIIRPLPKEAMARGAIQPGKKDKKRVAEEEANGGEKRVKGDETNGRDAKVVEAVKEELEKQTEFQTSELVSG